MHYSIVVCENQADAKTIKYYLKQGSAGDTTPYIWQDFQGLNEMAYPCVKFGSRGEAQQFLQDHPQAAPVNHVVAIVSWKPGSAITIA